MTRDVNADDMGKEIDAQRWAIKNGDFSAAFKWVGHLLRGAFAATFAATASYTEGLWKPRKRPGDGHPLLIDTADMFRGATVEGAKGHIADYRSREMSEGIDGAVIPYAAAQNFGFPERNLPARRFIDVDEGTMKQIDDHLADVGLDLMGDQLP